VELSMAMASTDAVAAVAADTFAPEREGLDVSFGSLGSSALGGGSSLSASSNSFGSSTAEQPSLTEPASVPADGSSASLPSAPATADDGADFDFGASFGASSSVGAGGLEVAGLDAAASTLSGSGSGALGSSSSLDGSSFDALGLGAESASSAPPPDALPALLGSPLPPTASALGPPVGPPPEDDFEDEFGFGPPASDLSSLGLGSHTTLGGAGAALAGGSSDFAPVMVLDPDTQLVPDTEVALSDVSSAVSAMNLTSDFSEIGSSDVLSSTSSNGYHSNGSMLSASRVPSNSAADSIGSAGDSAGSPSDGVPGAWPAEEGALGDDS